MTQAFWAIKQSTGRGICTVNSIRFWEYDWTGGVFLTTDLHPTWCRRRGRASDLKGAWSACNESQRRPGLPTFQQNVEATIPALRRYARALTRDADIADDLVQDTLVRALRSEHLFHGGDVRSWLYTILTNLNRNRLRSLARRPVLSPIEDNDAPDLAGPEAGGATLSGRSQRWLKTSATPCCS